MKGRVGFLKFYSNADENIYDYYPVTEENVKKLADNSKLWSSDNYDKNNPPPYLGGFESISSEDLEFLKQLNEMGWYELDYYPED
jgi:hypothetical protein